VCTKYQEAAKIVNLALQGLVQQCVPGAKVIDLCEFGHSILNASAAKLYTKKSNGAAMDRGVAFPVCVSVNDVVCNDSPLLSEERVREAIKKGKWGGDSALRVRREPVMVVNKCAMIAWCVSSAVLGMSHRPSKSNDRKTNGGVRARTVVSSLRDRS
jgi:hypothetical protein